MNEITDLSYYQRKRDVILNKAKDYYKNNKEILKEQARDNYRSLSEEEKHKKREYRKNRYHNMPEEKKKAIKEKSRIVIKTCHKKKTTRLKSTKEKGIKKWFNIKRIVKK